MYTKKWPKEHRSCVRNCLASRYVHVCRFPQVPRRSNNTLLLLVGQSCCSLSAMSQCTTVIELCTKRLQRSCSCLKPNVSTSFSRCNFIALLGVKTRCSMFLLFINQERLKVKAEFGKAKNWRIREKSINAKNWVSLHFYTNSPNRGYNHSQVKMVNGNVLIY